MELWQGEIPLYNEAYQNTPENQGTPSLDLFLTDQKDGSRGLIMICPGGGYAMRAEHEGAGYAKFLNEHGFHAAVLQYRVAPYCYPAAFYDALRGIRLIRYHAKEWGINPNKIVVMGSSAGGHLAGTLATSYMDAPAPRDEIDRCNARPDLAVLCYPVITAGYYQHQGSIENLQQTDPAATEFLDKISLEKRVTADTPPMFLWHTADDDVVPVQNSLLMAQALREKNIPVTLHIYEHGYHGLGLAQDSECHSWTGLLIEWLKKHGI
jgi:acetyl esterase/lipase